MTTLAPMNVDDPAPYSKGIAVVVCTRDRPALLERNVESLSRHLRRQDAVVLVDSASRDPTTVAAIARQAGFASIRLERPGASRARNAGAAATDAPLLAFTDDDCVITEGWSTAFERVLSDTAVGFVTGRVLADEEVNVPMVVLGESPRRFEGPDEDPMECGASANVGFRREAFDAVGGFDEMLGPGARLGVAEDHDLFWRVLRAGWVGLYEPSITVVHRQWRTRGAAIRSHFAYGRGSGAFAMKAVRLGDSSGWKFLRTRVWGEGIVRAVKSLRGGYESGAAADAVRTAGVVVGAARATWIGLVDGRYAERRK